MNKRVLGLDFSEAGTTELTQTIVANGVPRGEGPRVVATANLDHVVNMSTNGDLRRAYSRAWAVTADGTPVYLYARMRGRPLPERVTGSDLCGRILDKLRPGAHRLFFVVSSEATAEGIKDAMARRGFAAADIRMCVPPFGFEANASYSNDLAQAVGEHQTTHLFLGVGSPKSEVWTDQYRSVIGDCYALNFGAGLDFFAGTKKRAPKILRLTGMEWTWRLISEPRRLARRYLVNSWRFLWIVGTDLSRSKV